MVDGGTPGGGGCSRRKVPFRGRDESGLALQSLSCFALASVVSEMPHNGRPHVVLSSRLCPSIFPPPVLRLFSFHPSLMVSMFCISISYGIHLLWHPSREASISYPVNVPLCVHDLVGCTQGETLLNLSQFCMEREMGHYL